MPGCESNTKDWRWPSPFTLQRAGEHELFVTYASGEERPVRVALNWRMLNESALAGKTGGFSNELV
jgi:hypothetical protein